MEHGKPKQVSHKRFEVRYVGNVQCAGVTRAITTEVELPKRTKQRLCENVRTIDPLVPRNVNIFVNWINKTKDQNDQYSNARKAIVLTAPFYRPKNGHDVSHGIALHEALHTAYMALPEDDPDRAQIDAAYNQITQNMRYRMPTLQEEDDGYDFTANEPAWAALTEKTYEQSELGYSFSIDGHPWDSATEMASSTMQSMALYPDAFIARYKKLNTTDRILVRDAVRATLRLVEHTIKGKAPISSVLPAYDLLSETFEK